ncbi:NUDIX hydrolase [Haloferacaceae archaeon DSL9]
MRTDNVTRVEKACAYITRGSNELLVFDGPEHEGLQVPKGTIEPNEAPADAVIREIMEESGLDASGRTQPLITDVWTRRRSPPREYVRHFFHAPVQDARDRWTHTVTGEGSEAGFEFEYSWITLPTARDFALDLDDYVDLLGRRVVSP